MVRTRITPDCRSIASKAPTGACVVRTACPGGSCKPRASDFATITGLLRASRRASRENFRGLPIDSRYSPQTAVSASSSQYCMMSLPETSARLPAETTVEKPKPRCTVAANSAAPSAADWLNRPRLPRLGMVGAREAFKDTPGRVLTTPNEAGPISRMPPARAVRTKPRCATRPSSPSSAKPPVAISTPLLPAAAHSATVAGT